MKQTLRTIVSYLACTAIMGAVCVAFSSHSNAIGNAPDGEKQSKKDIERAFMNCLLGVDAMAEEYSGESKIIESEVESETKRCHRLRDSCKNNPATSECEVFVEEFLKG